MEAGWLAGWLVGCVAVGLFFTILPKVEGSDNILFFL